MSHLHHRKPGALLSLANWVETQDENPGAARSRPVPREPEMRADEAFLNDVSRQMHRLAGEPQSAAAPSIGELLRRRGEAGAEAPVEIAPAVVATPAPRARRLQVRAEPVRPEANQAVPSAGGKKGIFSRFGGIFSRGDSQKSRGKDAAPADGAEVRVAGPLSQEPVEQERPGEPGPAANDTEIMAGYFAQLSPETTAAMQQLAPMQDSGFGEEPHDEWSAAAVAHPPHMVAEPQPEMRHWQGPASAAVQSARHDPAAQPGVYPQPTPWQPAQPPGPMQFAPPPAGQPYPVWLPQPASAHFYWSTPQPAPMQPAMPWPGAVPPVAFAPPPYAEGFASDGFDRRPPTPGWENYGAPAASHEGLAAEVDEVRERLRDFAELLQDLRELRRTG